MLKANGDDEEVIIDADFAVLADRTREIGRE